MKKIFFSIIAALLSQQALATKISYDYICEDKTEAIRLDQNFLKITEGEVGTAWTVKSFKNSTGGIDLLDVLQFRLGSPEQKYGAILVKDRTDFKVVRTDRDKGGMDSSSVTESLNLTVDIILHDRTLKDLPLSCVQTTYFDDN